MQMCVYVNEHISRFPTDLWSVYEFIIIHWAQQ